MKPFTCVALGFALAVLLLLRPVAPFGLPLEEDSAEDSGEDGDIVETALGDAAAGAAAAGVERPGASACADRVAGCVAGLRPAAQRRPVCGSDGVTYSTRCHMLRAQCQGTAVTLRHKGPCKDAKPCWADRRHAQMQTPRQAQLQGQQQTQQGQAFAPRCLEDGSYAPVQCHGETGYCWCVTPMGRPLPNTSRRNKAPDCSARKGRPGTRRRSSAAGRKNKKGCGRSERSQFVSSLLHHFRAEYGRLPPPEAGVGLLSGSSSSGESSAEASGAVPPPLPSSASPPPAGGGVPVPPERAALAWKFSQLDADGDGALSRAEAAALRRAARRVARPRRCARLFPRLCDRDADKRVSREEWAACLGLDFNQESHTEGAGVPTKEEGEWKKNLTTRALLRDTLSQLKVVRRTSSQMLQGSMSTRPGLGDDILDTKEEPEANDCLSDRKTALEEQVSGTSALYIPECTPDGRYKKVQCYTSTGYCWCVYEDTGIVIPGTSVKDQKPNCDIVPPPSRPMAGCPEPRKQIFLKEFLDFMKKKMISTKEKSTSESAFLSLNGGPEEAVATWAFQNLDKNKNKVWERKEWKSFRTLVMSQPTLRRCGKRLPRYCDVNNDQKISLTEWLNCMKNHQHITAMNIRTQSNVNRNGTNPLMIYLKAS